MNELLPSVRAVLETTAPRWLTLAATLPPDLLQRPPAPGEWSAIECLRHLSDAERDVFPVRVRAFLAGHDLTPYDPVAQASGDAGETPLALAEDFARLRQESLTLLAQVQPSDLNREVIHREYGPVRLAELLHQWAAHDLMHTVQAEQALMQPFVAGSGPWRSTFAAHDVAREA
jgi:hypothetical protein